MRVAFGQTMHQSHHRQRALLVVNNTHTKHFESLGDVWSLMYVWSQMCCQCVVKCAVIIAVEYKRTHHLRIHLKECSAGT